MKKSIGKVLVGLLLASALIFLASCDFGVSHDYQAVYGVVGGIVVDANGQPVEGAIVTMVTAGEVPEAASASRAILNFTTGTDGTFEFSNLTSGYHTVGVQLDGYFATQNEFYVPTIDEIEKMGGTNYSGIDGNASITETATGYYTFRQSVRPVLYMPEFTLTGYLERQVTAGGSDVPAVGVTVTAIAELVPAVTAVAASQGVPAVRAVPAVTVEVSAVTDANGMYSISGLPPIPADVYTSALYVDADDLFYDAAQIATAAGRNAGDHAVLVPASNLPVILSVDGIGNMASAVLADSTITANFSVEVAELSAQIGTWAVGADLLPGTADDVFTSEKDFVVTLDATGLFATLVHEDGFLDYGTNGDKYISFSGTTTDGEAVSSTGFTNAVYTAAPVQLIDTNIWNVDGLYAPASDLLYDEESMVTDFPLAAGGVITFQFDRALETDTTTYPVEVEVYRAVGEPTATPLPAGGVDYVGDPLTTTATIAADTLTITIADALEADNTNTYYVALKVKSDRANDYFETLKDATAPVAPATVATGSMFPDGADKVAELDYKGFYSTGGADIDEFVIFATQAIRLATTDLYDVDGDTRVQYDGAGDIIDNPAGWDIEDAAATDTALAIGSNLVLTFDKDLDTALDYTDADVLVLSEGLGGEPIAITATPATNTLTIDPVADLKPETDYYLYFKVQASSTDVGKGQNIWFRTEKKIELDIEASNFRTYTWTGAGVGTTETPANVTDFTITDNVIIEFTKPLTADNTATDFTLTQAGDEVPATITVTTGSSTVTIDPTDPLLTGTTYRVNYYAIAGPNDDLTDFQDFITEDAISRTETDFATGDPGATLGTVGISDNLVLTFDKTVDATSTVPTDFYLYWGTGTQSNEVVDLALTETGQTVTINPDFALDYDTLYSLTYTVYAGATDSFTETITFRTVIDESFDAAEQVQNLTLENSVGHVSATGDIDSTATLFSVTWDRSVNRSSSTRYYIWANTAEGVIPLMFDTDPVAAGNQWGNYFFDQDDTTFADLEIDTWTQAIDLTNSMSNTLFDYLGNGFDPTDDDTGAIFTYGTTIDVFMTASNTAGDGGDDPLTALTDATRSPSADDITLTDTVDPTGGFWQDAAGTIAYTQAIFDADLVAPAAGLIRTLYYIQSEDYYYDLVTLANNEADTKVVSANAAGRIFVNNQEWLDNRTIQFDLNSDGTAPVTGDGISVSLEDTSQNTDVDSLLLP